MTENIHIPSNLIINLIENEVKEQIEQQLKALGKKVKVKNINWCETGLIIEYDSKE